MTVASDLFGLQELDSSIDALAKEQNDINTALAGADTTAALRERVAARQKALGDARSRATDVETQIHDLNAKIEPIERRLYDGSVRIPRDLEDLQKEIAMLTRQRGALEDQQLVLMEEVDRTGQSLSTDRAALDQAEAEQSSTHGSLSERLVSIEEELVRLRAERERRAARMDPQRLRLYEHLRAIKRGRAVVRLERGACTGCRITLPTTIQQRARNPMQVIQCTSCERILYTG